MALMPRPVPTGHSMRVCGCVQRSSTATPRKTGLDKGASLGGKAKSLLYDTEQTAHCASESIRVAASLPKCSPPQRSESALPVSACGPSATPPLPDHALSCRDAAPRRPRCAVQTVGAACVGLRLPKTIISQLELVQCVSELHTDARTSISTEQPCRSARGGRCELGSSRLLTMADSTVSRLESSAAYAEKKKLFQLFEKLLQDLLVHKPKDPIAHLISTLKVPEVARVILLGPPGTDLKLQACAAGSNDVHTIVLLRLHCACHVCTYPPGGNARCEAQSGTRFCARHLPRGGQGREAGRCGGEETDRLGRGSAGEMLPAKTQPLRDAAFIAAVHSLRRLLLAHLHLWPKGVRVHPCSVCACMHETNARVGDRARGRQ
eukprot:104996-Pleurochrysis_carterae.AAC.3